MYPALFESGLFPETLILILRLFGRFNPLALGRCHESRIDHQLVDRVPRLGDDKLQVQVGQTGTTMVCVPVQSGFTE